MTDRMKKINILIDESNKKKELNSKRIARIGELNKDINKLKDQSGIATANGNLEAFKELVHQIQDKEIEIDFLNKQLEIEKNTILEQGRVKNAWEDYESKRSAILKKAKDKRASAVELLYEAMKEIMELQNEGIKTRNICADLVGIPPYKGELNQDNFAKLDELFKMEYAENITRGKGHPGNPTEIRMLMALDKYPSDNESSAQTYILFNTFAPVNLSFLR